MEPECDDLPLEARGETSQAEVGVHKRVTKTPGPQE